MNSFFKKDKENILSKALEFVRSETKISISDLYSVSRNRDIANSRFVVWYILHTEFGFSIPLLAREFKKSPSTVSHGLGFVKKEGVGKDVVSKFFKAYPHIHRTNNKSLKK
jgi:chromosomal replication initiation ATPase DnaA